MPLLYCHLPTPLGEMLAIASGQGLCLLEFVGQNGVGREQVQVEAARGGPAREGMNAILEQTCAELAEYFAGRRRAFGVPLDLVGTRARPAPSAAPRPRARWRRPTGRTRSRSSCPATA